MGWESSLAASLKLGNGWVNPSHTLLGNACGYLSMLRLKLTRCEWSSREEYGYIDDTNNKTRYIKTACRIYGILYATWENCLKLPRLFILDYVVWFQSFSIFIQSAVQQIAPQYYQGDSRFVSSQWETALLCYSVSHWLGANLESALITNIHKSDAGKTSNLY